MANNAADARLREQARNVVEVEQTKQGEDNNNIQQQAAPSAPANLNDYYESISKSIAVKWNLTSPTAVGLLVDQFHK